MKPTLELLESRTCLAVPLAAPEVTILAIGTDPAPWTAFTKVLISDYSALLAPYGVGQGTIAGTISLPSRTPLSDADVRTIIVSEVQAGAIHADSNTLVMVYLPNNVTDRWASRDTAYHSTVWTDGQWISFAIDYTQPGESIPASHEYAEATSGQEIADPVAWQWFNLDGYSVSQFVLPNGRKVHPDVLTTPPPTQPPAEWSMNQPVDFRQLAMLAIAEFKYLTVGLLSHLDARDFGTSAAQARQAVRDDPLSATMAGEWAVLVGETWFFAALSGPPSSAHP